MEALEAVHGWQVVVTQVELLSEGRGKGVTHLGGAEALGVFLRDCPLQSVFFEFYTNPLR